MYVYICLIFKEDTLAPSHFGIFKNLNLLGLPEQIYSLTV